MNHHAVSTEDQKQPETPPLTAEESNEIGAIYEKWRYHVERIARSFTKNFYDSEDSEELISEFWSWASHNRLFASYDSSKGSFEQFLNTTCRNKMIDIRRKQIRFRKNYRPVPIDDRPENDGLDVVNTDALPADHREPLNEIIKAEASTRIQAALKSLPPQQEKVITLRYIRGLSTSETAKVLGVSLSTVKTHLAKAKTRLKKRLLEISKGR